tara:strand:+ start:140 stop:4582 length:4443 start_codon:yes stop_codon:yes gene_type:complete
MQDQEISNLSKNDYIESFKAQIAEYKKLDIVTKSILNILSFFPYCQIELYILQQSIPIKQILGGEHDRANVLYEKLYSVLEQLKKQKLLNNHNQVTHPELAFYIANQTANESIWSSYLECVVELSNLLKQTSFYKANYHGHQFAVTHFEILRKNNNIQPPERLSTFYNYENLYDNDSDWLNYFSEYFYQLDAFKSNPKEIVKLIKSLPEQYKYYYIASIIFNTIYSNDYKNLLIDNKILDLINEDILNENFYNHKNLAVLIKYPLALKYILFNLNLKAEFQKGNDIIISIQQFQQKNVNNIHLVTALSYVAYSYSAWHEFFFMNHEAANQYFHQALKIYKNLEITKPASSLPGFNGLLYLINLIYLLNHHSHVPGDLKNTLKKFQKMLPDESQVHYYSNIKFVYPFICNLLELATGNISVKEQLQSTITDAKNNPRISSILTDSLLMTTASYWIDINIEENLSEIIKNYNYNKNDFPLIAKSAYDIINETNIDYENFIEAKNLTNDFFEHNPELEKVINLKSLINTDNLWENQISLLKDKLTQPITEITKPVTRFVWYFEDEINIENLKCASQKKLKNKNWGSIKEVNLQSLKYRRIKPGKTFLAQDYNILDSLPDFIYGKELENVFEILENIANHSDIYIKHNQELHKLDINITSPTLQIRRQENKFLIKLSVYCLDINKNTTIDKNYIALHDKALLYRLNTHQYKVININEEILNIASILSDTGISLPESAKEQVLDLIKDICPNITIEIDSSFDESLIKNKKAANITPIFQAAFEDDNLELNLIYKPFNDTDIYKPCHGMENIIINKNNEPLLIKRDFAQEKTIALNIIKDIPFININNNYSWIIESFEESLNVLSYFKSNQNKYNIEWQSDKITLSHSKSFDSLALNIKYDKDWFTINGELKTDDDKVISLQNILTLLSENNNSKYIKLSDNKYIALTEELKNKLSQINAIAQRSKSKSHNPDLEKLKFHKLASHVINDFEKSGAVIDADLNWRNYINNIKNIKKVSTDIPSNINAELRPYQKEGFIWIQKLFNIGAGACLADDMGLGKTLQTITTIAAYNKNGPCLVIAPTSVCYNWEAECHKFCSDLNTVLFNTANKHHLLENLDNNQVVICSYGLMQNNIDDLSKIKWSLVVLDEAQSIKNAATKRSKAVMKLDAENKIALTGTPIENHLGELWSIFRFLNNGLLGSVESFRKRFLNPITVDKDLNALNALKNLIKPFVLRRLKDDVLKDLPEKTDQTIFIEQSSDEANFYQAVCSNAIQNVQKIMPEVVQKGQKKFNILAEIMKLRRACCHSSLVNTEINIESSKLKYLERLINDLKENNHKVLVFSQFVSYLKIVKELFESNEIKYEYLDGSTKPVDRKTRINNFQNGNADVFLLSLKAGGTGLNLTKANYVIHLDPWWNPAVENQASDRAHRFGQTQKVTIYRLIMKNTIEEKIVEFHEEKKHLSKELLDDSKMVASLSEEQLLDLIKIN